jgi:hypothetical protein
LLTVCCRQSLLFAANPYRDVVNRVLERIENDKDSTGSRDESEFGREFIRDLQSFAEFFTVFGAFCGTTTP